MNYHLSIPLVLCLFTFNGECDNKPTPTKAECKKSAIRYVEERIAPQQSSSVSIKNLKELLSMPQESVIDTCDLSNQQLSKIPILRQYKIKVLILSHNQLKGKINVFDLPPVLEVLDISHNRLTGSLYLNNYAKKLKRVLCQYNDLEALSVPLSTVYVDASHNRLWAFYLGDDKSKEGPFPLSYLNLSYNPTLVRGLDFNVEEIDTVISTGTPPLKRLELYF